MTSESDYRKIQESFGDTGFLESLSNYLTELAEELGNIGIALQSGTKAKSLRNLDHKLDAVFDEYFDLRNKNLGPDTLENFMIMRIILVRVANITDQIKTIYKVFTQDQKLAKSLSTGLDFDKFVPSEPFRQFSAYDF